MIDTTNKTNNKENKIRKRKKDQELGIKDTEGGRQREGSESKWLMRVCVADTVSLAGRQAGLYGIIG